MSSLSELPGTLLCVPADASFPGCFSPRSAALQASPHYPVHSDQGTTMAVLGFHGEKVTERVGEGDHWTDPVS